MIFLYVPSDGVGSLSVENGAYKGGWLILNTSACKWQVIKEVIIIQLETAKLTYLSQQQQQTDIYCNTTKTSL